VSVDMLGQLNWLAVIVGALIYFVLGAVWYAPPIFGRAWQRSIGWDPEAAPPQMRITTYAIPAVAYLVMAAATGMLAAATGSDNLESGLILGLVVGIGFALARPALDATFTPNLAPAGDMVRHNRAVPPGGSGHRCRSWSRSGSDPIPEEDPSQAERASGTWIRPAASAGRADGAGLTAQGRTRPKPLRE
jgi:Protein of unknown function (DUF1761)